MRMIFILSILFPLLLACGEDPQDDDLPTVIRISIEDISVQEGNSESNLFVRLQLSAPAENSVTAIISTMDETARAGEDYLPLDNVPVIFEPGDQLKEHQMQILGDEEPEDDEVFKITIISAEGTEISKGTATISLLNDDQSTTEVVIPTTGYSTPLSYPGMDLIWQDEFDGENIDESFWTFEIGTGSNGWGNNELQFYRKENAWIQEGHLVIEARKEGFGGRAYTSTRMITKDKFTFRYGRVDIRANLPFGQGIWPALWTLGNNISTVSWPACGEIDIMELVGHQPDVTHGTAHWSSSGTHAQHGGSTKLNQGIFNDEFHVFSIIWNSSSIQWMLDDVVYHTLNITPAELSEFHLDHFFIFNVAVGGNWPGSPDGSTIFPQRMIVDYIRVFQ